MKMAALSVRLSFSIARQKVLHCHSADKFSRPSDRSGWPSPTGMLCNSPAKEKQQQLQNNYSSEERGVSYVVITKFVGISVNNGEEHAARVPVEFFFLYCRTTWTVVVHGRNCRLDAQHPAVWFSFFI
jgi:hypothetical protein